MQRYKNYKKYMKFIDSMNCEEFLDYMNKDNFEIFKSNICHFLKSMGDLPFLIAIFKKDIIRYCYKNDMLLECYYLLGMTDYLCRINGLPYDGEYSDIRQYELGKRVFPGGVNILCSVLGNEMPKKEALEKAIPEFLRFNIVELGIRDVA